MQGDRLLTPLEAEQAHFAIRERGFLVMWVVTRNTKDYPDKVVVRPRIIGQGTDQATNAVLLADTLEELREQLPRDLVQLDRHPNDDPVIVETWI